MLSLSLNVAERERAYLPACLRCSANSDALATPQISSPQIFTFVRLLAARAITMQLPSILVRLSAPNPFSSFLTLAMLTLTPSVLCPSSDFSRLHRRCCVVV